MGLGVRKEERRWAPALIEAKCGTSFFVTSTESAATKPRKWRISDKSWTNFPAILSTVFKVQGREGCQLWMWRHKISNTQFCRKGRVLDCSMSHCTSLPKPNDSHQNTPCNSASSRLPTYSARPKHSPHSSKGHISVYHVATVGDRTESSVHYGIIKMEGAGERDIRLAGESRK